MHINGFDELDWRSGTRLFIVNAAYPLILRFLRIFQKILSKGPTTSEMPWWTANESFGSSGLSGGGGPTPSEKCREVVLEMKI